MQLELNRVSNYCRTFSPSRKKNKPPLRSTLFGKLQCELYSWFLRFPSRFQNIGRFLKRHKKNLGYGFSVDSYCYRSKYIRWTLWRIFRNQKYRIRVIEPKDISTFSIIAITGKNDRTFWKIVPRLEMMTVLCKNVRYLRYCLTDWRRKIKNQK